MIVIALRVLHFNQQAVEVQARERGRGEEIKKQRDVRRRIFTTARLGRQNKHSKYNYKYTCSARAHTHRCMCARACAYGCTRVCVDSHEKGFFSRTCVKHLIGVSKKEREGNKCERKMDLRIHRSVPFLFVFLFLFLFYFILLHFYFFQTADRCLLCFYRLRFSSRSSRRSSSTRGSAAAARDKLVVVSVVGRLVDRVLYSHTARSAQVRLYIVVCVCVYVRELCACLPASVSACVCVCVCCPVSGGRISAQITCLSLSPPCALV